MNMKRLKVLAGGLIGVIALSATTLINSREFEIVKNLEIFSNVYRELNANYADDIDPGQIMKVGIDAMLKTCDPFTNYFSENIVESSRYLRTGKYEGIGAVVKTVDNYPTILRTLEKSPATESGLTVGDQILAINGQSAEGKSPDDMSVIFKGAPGTDINFRVQRDGTPLDITLTRKDVSVPNVPHSQMLDNNVGYITLTQFSGNASANVIKAYRNLITEDPDIKGLVLDLRGNGGGFLREAVGLSNMFIPANKEVVSTRSKVSERDRTFKTQNTPVDEEIPLVVLINKSSASASEIVSGVVQDYDRGVVMGQRSYGKGLVQNTFDVGYNAKMKVTTSKYYIPSGRCIQGIKYENGQAVDIPIEERVAFKTSNGRTVYDGGGVMPDVKLEDVRDTELIRDLREGDYIFKFVNQYKKNIPETLTPGSYVFNDWKSFLSYLDKVDFTYTSEAQDELQKFYDKAHEEGLLNKVNKAYTSLQSEIEKAHRDALEEQKSTIISLIEEEIVGRSFYEKGRIMQKIARDPEIKEAVALINDQARYSAILQVK